MTLIECHNSDTINGFYKTLGKKHLYKVYSMYQVIGYCESLYPSPTILSPQFVSLTAGETVTPSIGPGKGGGHIATDVNKRVHLLQSELRLARALPGAV